jgi:hypothetical protein
MNQHPREGLIGNPSYEDAPFRDSNPDCVEDRGTSDTRSQGDKYDSQSNELQEPNFSAPVAAGVAVGVCGDDAGHAGRTQRE